MSAGVEFPAESVLRHADAVREAAAEMAQARAAAGEVSMDNEAYGQPCQFLPALLSPLFGSAAEVMKDAEDALGETALKLRTTVSDMTAADTGSARRLNAAVDSDLDLPL